MELSDRICVMFDGELVFEANIESASRATIGEYMAGLHPPVRSAAAPGMDALPPLAVPV
jgi:ABC-type sugar transport system ATPase subunit